jgi:NAD(P)-dependent dehydrogenase (short-subunit alcohol dehydrogenase family)
MKDVQDKVAFITGGASGIGLGIAGAFVEAGMRVVLADLRQDHIDAALGAFRERGQSKNVHAIRVDVTDRAAMAAAADQTERVFGKVHVLVNNAGVGIQGPFKGITYADWDFGLAVNLGGVINGLQTFLPRIRAHGEGGHIVNTASLAALVPMPAQFVIYVAAKAAVVTISETIRTELMHTPGPRSCAPVPSGPTSRRPPATGRRSSAWATPFATPSRPAQRTCHFPA